MPVPDLSVLFVSFNTAPLLGAALDALPAAAGGLSFEAIVVDNASSDGTPERVRRQFPSARLVESGGNLGFARAMNLGLAIARGRVLVWLNPDCVPAPGSLAALVAYLDAHPEVGAVGPSLRHPDGRVLPSAQRFQDVWHVVFHFLGVRRLARNHHVRGLLRRSARAGTRAYLDALEPGGSPRDVDWVSGACLATRADVARTVGPLDEAYFMYCEDADWCHRVHEAGLRVRLVPAVEVVHHAGASGAANPGAVFHYYRSQLHYFKQHQPRQFAIIRTLMFGGFVMRGVGNWLGRVAGRTGGHPWWRLAALCWATAV